MSPSAIYLGPYVPPASHQRTVSLVQTTAQLVDPSANYTAAIVLKLKAGSEDALKETLHKVSDPSSAHYGKYLSKDEMVALTAPADADVQNVVNWVTTGDCGSSSGHALAASSVHAKLAGGGDIIWVSGKLHDVESRFGTKLALFAHGERQAIRAEMPLAGVPECAAAHMAFVTLNAPIPPGRARKSARMSRDATDGNFDASASATRQLQLQAAGAAALTTRQSRVHVWQRSRKHVRIAFQPMCKTTPDAAHEVACGAWQRELRELRVTFSTTWHGKPQPAHTLGKHAHVLSNSSVACGERSADSGEACRTPERCTCEVSIEATSEEALLLPLDRPFVAHVQQLGARGGAVEVGESAAFQLQDSVTPQVLRSQYGWPETDTVPHSGATQAVAEFYGEFYSNDDLKQFLKKVDEPRLTLPVQNVRGNLPNNQANPGGEASLDIQYLMSLAPKTPTFFYSYSDLNPYTSENEGFLTWLVELGGEVDPPLVQSLSYGDVEADVFNMSNGGGAARYAARVDLEFAKLGARGVSIVVASGDDGSGGFLAKDDPSGCNQAAPEWPASSPYVTTVGATQLAWDGDISAEAVCNARSGGVITSGGGFSNIYARPEWQAAAVAKLVAQHPSALPPGGFYNKTGRAYPDITALGSRFLVYLNGMETELSGTSASTPVVAAMVSQFNEARAAEGMPPMGFLTPFLYATAASNPAAFTDVTDGDIGCFSGGTTTARCCEHTFSAAEGWDAASGLGSPNYQQLLASALEAGKKSRRKDRRKFSASSATKLNTLNP
mgnify:CR=1 FL=1